MHGRPSTLGTRPSRLAAAYAAMNIRDEPDPEPRGGNGSPMSGIKLWK
jgi:hypothetical protein